MSAMRKLLAELEEGWSVTSWDQSSTERKSLVDLLRDEAGNYALRASEASDFRVRKLAQDRERAYDRLATALQRFCPIMEKRGNE